MIKGLGIGKITFDDIDSTSYAISGHSINDGADPIFGLYEERDYRAYNFWSTNLVGLALNKRAFKIKRSVRRLVRVEYGEI